MITKSKLHTKLPNHVYPRNSNSATKPYDSKGNISDELIDYLQGYTEYTSGKTFEFELAESKHRFSFNTSKIRDQAIYL